MKKAFLSFRKHGISLLLILFFTSYMPYSWAGLIANPIPELAKTLSPNELSLEEVRYLGVQAEAYCGPNEKYPARMRSITESAPEGVYWGVGTERCLMSALINPQFNFLILADYDPRVVLYNQINLALLRVSSTRDEYLDLRLKASHWAWIEALNRAALVDSDDESLLLSSFAYSWWEETVRSNEAKNRNHLDMIHFQTPPQSEARKNSYVGAHYLFDDALFARIQSLALQGKIQVTQADLKSNEQFERIVQAIESRKMLLSVFDCSNGWHCQYRIGFPRLHRIVNRLRDISNDESIFLGTALAKLTDRIFITYADDPGEFRFRQKADISIEVHFTYFGAKIANLQTKEDWKRFHSMLDSWEDPKEKKLLLSPEVERKNAHLLAEWRLPGLRKDLDPNYVPECRTHSGTKLPARLYSRPPVPSPNLSQSPGKYWSLFPRFLKRK